MKTRNFGRRQGAVATYMARDCFNTKRSAVYNIELHGSLKRRRQTAKEAMRAIAPK
jgi:hypothetical protein